MNKMIAKTVKGRDAMDAYMLTQGKQKKVRGIEKNKEEKETKR